MPRVQVIADDGWLALDEHVSASKVTSELYRRQLGERIGWAVVDAEARARAGATVQDDVTRPELAAA